MKFKELKNKTEKELRKVLLDSRNNLRELRFKAANDQLKNVREIREQKRLISRLLFLLNKKDSKAKETKGKDNK